MSEKAIGMFDSGVGGMTVLKEVKKKLPNENYVYLADNKNFPYGEKSKEQIINLTRKGIQFLISQNVKLIVIACGTATSQALEAIKNDYEIPIIGVIEPTVKYIKEKQYKKIGVIATKGTIRSKGWENAIINSLPNVQIRSKACPLLAPIIEEGWTNNEIAELIVKEYLKDLKEIDALILGCTHYPLLEDVIKKQLPSSTEILNIGKFVAIEVEKFLKEKDIENNGAKQEDKIFLTDTNSNFCEIASQIMQKEVKTLRI